VAAGGVAVNFIAWYTLISRYTINGRPSACHSGEGGADTPSGTKRRRDNAGRTCASFDSVRDSECMGAGCRRYRLQGRDIKR